MISIYLLKSRFQNLLLPLAKRLIQIGISANQVTLFALFFSIGFGAFFSYLKIIPVWIGLVFLARMGLNALDGMIARMKKTESIVGCYLNELGDIISDAALYIPFALASRELSYYVMVIVFLSSLSETTGILGQAVRGKRRYDGPMGKSDRAFWFSLIAIGYFFHLPINLIAAAYLFICVSLIISIFFRVKNAVKNI